MDSTTYVMEIFSGLVAFNKDLQIVPEIAEKWDTSADGKVYTFHLRQNVKFHDGTDFNAKAVKANFDRMPSPYASHQADLAKARKEEGFNPHLVKSGTQVRTD